ncbi:hypothetical protein LC605_12420 [Nostoc sp. CHAB 5836]|uniref:hypothetical protein n=1 Tax=Nostoc sp. CHAB 5836 TaxID=2780404 RepID=UPI001E62F568|nr:hypothetical protein [Nostoc sp. CHAB 5836]MCC5615859.1 hypothetical protein [Nostoc sp. CHAB 5836]
MKAKKHFGCVNNLAKKCTWRYCYNQDLAISQKSKLSSVFIPFLFPITLYPLPLFFINRDFQFKKYSTTSYGVGTRVAHPTTLNNLFIRHLVKRNCFDVALLRLYEGSG